MWQTKCLSIKFIFLPNIRMAYNSALTTQSLELVSVLKNEFKGEDLVVIKII